MSRYLFIQSQDPFTETRTKSQFDLAKRLVSAGESVVLLLVQNAVTAARYGAKCDQFDSLSRFGVTLLADQFSLRQREITDKQLKPIVNPVDIGFVIDAMLDGYKVIWN